MLHLLILLMGSALAEDQACSVPGLPNVPAFVKPIDSVGNSDKVIGKAPCKPKTVPTETELEEFIKSRSGTGKKDANVHSVEFKDESPVLIEAFKGMTTFRDYLGWRPEPDMQKDIQHEYAINPECTKVMCAMEKIWGGEMAKKLLYLSLKHGFIGSEIAFDRSDRFTPKELDTVLLGIDALPEHLHPVGRNHQRLNHYTRKRYPEGYKTAAANAAIMLFDKWEQQNSSNAMQETIFHELAHNVSRRMNNMDMSPEWLALSGWVKKGDVWTADANACVPTEYGQTNPVEDFAETLSTYRYNGKALKDLCPEKYKFVKEKVFKGIEYDEEKSCMSPSAEKVSAAVAEMDKALAQKFDGKMIDGELINRSCKEMIAQWPPLVEEVHMCTAKIFLASDPEIEATIGKALEAAGIPDIPANRENLRSAYAQGTQREKFKSRSLEIARTMEASALKTIDASVAATASKAPNEINQSSVYAKGCKEALFNLDTKTFTECQNRNYVRIERGIQAWRDPSKPLLGIDAPFTGDAATELAELHDKKLTDALDGSSKRSKDVRKLFTEFLATLKNHRADARATIKETPGWKDLSPEDFCSTTYGRASYRFFDFGLSQDEPLPKVKEWCVKAQSESAKRFEFTPKVWNTMLKELFPGIK